MYKEIVQGVRITELRVLLPVKGDLNDVLPAHAVLQQMRLEEVEEQIALPAAPDARHDLDETIAPSRESRLQFHFKVDIHQKMESSLNTHIYARPSPPLAQESGDWPTAWKWEDDVFEAVSHLEEFPLSGSVVREFGRADIRQVLLGDCRIIYRVKNDIPEIISIRHGHFCIRSPRSL